MALLPFLRSEGDPNLTLFLQLITVEIAQRCATLETGYNATVEQRSSNPYDPLYFRPLSLPPNPPFWIWPDAATVAEVAAAVVRIESVSISVEPGMRPSRR